MISAFQAILNSVTLGIKLFFIIFVLSLENTIPKVLADPEVHKNFICLQWCIIVTFREPIRKTMVLFTLSFKPYICLNSPNIFKSV